MIIYDPQVERAFCTDFIVDFNPHQILYPEMPAYIPEVQLAEKLPVVFVKWIRDTYDSCEKAYYLDTGL